MKYISVERAINFNSFISKIDYPDNVINYSNIDSAMAQPMQAVFGHEPHITVFEKAMAYCFFISKNHPFFTANKRTASFVMLLFLKINGHPFPKSKYKVLEDYVLDLTEENISKEEFVIFLEKYCK